MTGFHVIMIRENRILRAISVDMAAVLIQKSLVLTGQGAASMRMNKVTKSRNKRRVND